MEEKYNKLQEDYKKLITKHNKVIAKNKKFEQIELGYKGLILGLTIGLIANILVALFN